MGAGSRPGDRRRALGSAGERAVADWYQQHGYEVLDQNWRHRSGELDLVLRHTHTIVFCEVKTRRSDAFGTPAEAVTRDKQRRIRALATQWLEEHPSTRGELRFDVAAVMVGANSPTIDVIEAAF